jgi:predicted nucleic acid-binding protein
MLTEIYISALLVDEGLADQVWEAWDSGLLSNCVAAWAWWAIVIEG